MKTNPCLAAALAAALTSTAVFGETPQSPPPPAKAGEAGQPHRTTLEPQPFLGIVTSDVPPALAAQLGLSDGFGLLVDDVLPESPAASAGLQKFDILKSFDDQQLINPDQLSTLVRAAGKGKDVSLTFIRKGQEQHVSAKIGERAMPERRPVGGPEPRAFPLERLNGGFGGRLERSGEDTSRLDELQKKIEREREAIGDQAARLGEKAREQADQARHTAEEVQERVRKELERAGVGRTPGAVASADVLREAQPGGGARVSVFSQNGVTTLDGAKSRLILRDNDGTIEVESENGHRTLKASDASGKEIFSGPVDTEEQRQAVPEKLRKKLDEIEIRQRTEIRGGPGAKTSISVEATSGSAAGNAQ